MTKPHIVRKFDPASAGANTPRLEHLALWSEDIDATAAFLDDALGWKRMDRHQQATRANHV